MGPEELAKERSLYSVIPWKSRKQHQFFQRVPTLCDFLDQLHAKAIGKADIVLIKLLEGLEDVEGVSHVSRLLAQMDMVKASAGATLTV